MFHEHKISKQFHLQPGCLFDSLFRVTSKKTSKLHITGSLWEEPTGDWWITPIESVPMYLHHPAANIQWISQIFIFKFNVLSCFDFSKNV